MSGPWDPLDDGATIAQLSGMDATMLLSMILQLVLTFYSNDEEYLRLEQCVQMLQSLLQILPEAGMMMQHQHKTVREVMERLNDTLQKADKLVGSFRDSSVLYRFFMGWKQARHLSQMQKNIDMHLHLYHLAIDFDTNCLHSIADSIQRTSAIAAAGVHLSDDDDDTVAIVSPQPDPQQPDLPS